MKNRKLWMSILCAVLAGVMVLSLVTGALLTLIG